VVAAVETVTGFQVRSHFLELFGVCPECQTKPVR
jgi:Fe2+ or Zn2+ uptake regulation protein